MFCSVRFFKSLYKTKIEYFYGVLYIVCVYNISKDCIFTYTYLTKCVCVSKQRAVILEQVSKTIISLNWNRCKGFTIVTQNTEMDVLCFVRLGWACQQEQLLRFIDNSSVLLFLYLLFLFRYIRLTPTTVRHFFIRSWHFDVYYNLWSRKIRLSHIGASLNHSFCFFGTFYINQTPKQFLRIFYNFIIFEFLIFDSFFYVFYLTKLVPW